MGLELGRIGGQMLKSDLVRLGVDLAFETDLLYLNVNDRKIGINTDAVSRELQINGSTKTTDLIVDTEKKAGNLIFSGNTIASSLGSINLEALGPNSYFNIPSLETAQLKFSNNVISSFDNANIEIRPHGTGSTIFGTPTSATELNVTGNLHSTGNITFNGDITFGSDNTDSITFNADISSSIIPNVPGLSLGTTDYRWASLETILVNGTDLDAQSVIAGASGIDLTLRPGNSYFVSKSGIDTNSGTHQNNTLLTVKKALELATAGDTVFIYPGEYEEELPLTVPVGVTVKGSNIRNVKIKPAPGFESKDVFLLNGETTVEDLTITGFRYDSILNVGYAFRFANNFTVTSRSPYIKNISVLTSGSVTSGTDPLGFDQGDAGRGAYLDGSVATSSSKEASMLFHAVTFITPNADCVIMTNGVRVEWLNSFIYYANRGLYAIQGLLGFASQGVKFGAEVRSIGSANIYGNYGAVADGANTLMYLISHNFAYIGTGKDTKNDTDLVIQANETVELNSGKIRYVTQDHRGDFRVGDAFYVDFKTGSTSISVNDLGVIGLSSLKFISGNDITFITADKIDTGNFNISEDTIRSLTGDVNLDAASNVTNFNNSTEVSGNLDVTGDVTVGGQVTVGDQPFDTATVVGKISSGINPDVTSTYNLGSSLKNWANIYLSNLNLDDIRISGNIIRTTTSNSDLELVPSVTGPTIDLARTLNNPNAYGTPANDFFGNGLAISENYIVVGAPGEDAGIPGVDSGKVYVFDAVSGTTLHVITNPFTFQNNTFFGTKIAVTGQYLIVAQPGANTGSGSIQLFNISTGALITAQGNPSPVGDGFFDNFGSALAADGDYVIVGASGEDDPGVSSSGKAYIFRLSNGILIFTHQLDNPNSYGTGQEDYFGTSVGISGNYAIVGAPGEDSSPTKFETGRAYIYNVTTGALLWTLADPEDNPSATFGASVAIQGNYALIGAPGINKAYIYNVTTGALIHTLNNPGAPGANFGATVDISEKYALVGAYSEDSYAGKAYVFSISTGSLLYTINNPNSGVPGQLSENSIAISNNYILVAAPRDLFQSGIAYLYSVSPNDAGRVVVPESDVLLEQNLTVDKVTTTKSIEIQGTTTVTGNINLAGNINQTGDRTVNGNLNVDNQSTFGNVRFNTNFITAINNNDLVLKAAGTGKVLIQPDVSITNNILVVGNINVPNVTVIGNAGGDVVTNGTITIQDNFITTVNANDDLDLRANGTGNVLVSNNDTVFQNDLTILGSSSFKDVDITGNLLFTGSKTLTGNVNQTGSGAISSGLSVGDAGTFGNVIFNTNWVGTTTGDLVLEAAGSGIVSIPTNNVIANNIYAGDTTFASVTIQEGVSATIITNTDLTITTNYITTNNLNTDLVLEASGTGKLYSPTNSWQVDNNLVVGQSTSLKNLNITGPLALTGNITQVGNKTQTGNTEISRNLSVTDRVQLGNVEFKTNFVSTTTGDLDLRASGTGIVRIPTNNVIVETEIFATTTNFSSINVSQTVTAANLTDNTILINGNVITTVNGNDNLVLESAGLGEVVFGSNALFDNNFTVNQQSFLKNIVVQGNITQTGNYQLTGNINRFGQTQLLGKFTNNNIAQFEEVQINTNRITSTSTNSDLELRANGTGKVLIPNNNFEITNNLTVGGLPTFSALNLSRQIVADKFDNLDILIQDNFITTTNGNKNLDLRGVGTGGVFLEEILFTPLNEIRTTSNNRDIIFTTAPANSFVIDKTSALKVPVGTTTNRPTLAQSDLRFNTSVNYFEGFSTAKRTFGGLFSEDRQTFVKQESVSNLGTIRFNAAGVEAMRATNSGLQINGLTVDNRTNINLNTISTLASAEDLFLVPNGTGKVQLSQNLKVIGNEFTNISATATPILFSSTGTGFYKFEGSAGIVIPVGDTTQRSFVDVGDTRWNTDLQTIEIYDGVQYISAGGAGGVTEAFMEDLSNIYAIILG